MQYSYNYYIPCFLEWLPLASSLEYYPPLFSKPLKVANLTVALFYYLNQPIFQGNCLRKYGALNL